ncbi:hypothetical protein V8C35DRAFT_245195 [Trichoderma chlorosporum]
MEGKKKEEYRTTRYTDLFFILFSLAVYLLTRDIKGFLFFFVLFFFLLCVVDWREKHLAGADVYTRSFVFFTNTFFFYYCLTLLHSLLFFCIPWVFFFIFLCRLVDVAGRRMEEGRRLGGRCQFVLDGWGCSNSLQKEWMKYALLMPFSFPLLLVRFVCLFLQR